MNEPALSRGETLAQIFQNRDFRLFAISNLLSLTGIWIVRVCAAWLTWELTHSKTWLGIMAFAELGPSVLVSLYAGAMADRRNRFEILKMGQTAQVALAIFLTALAATGAATVWTLLFILIGYSIAGGINLPARLAVTPSLVEPRHLNAASAVSSVTLNVTRLLGPLIAAPLIAASLEPVAFALATLAFAASALTLNAARQSDERAGDSPTRAATHLSVGYGEVWRTFLSERGLLKVFAAQFWLWLIVRPLTDMLPAFADQIFGAGEYGFSALTAAVGLGALAGAVMVMGEASEGRSRRWLLGGTILSALSMAAMAVVPSLWMALPVMLVYGVAITATGVVSTTFVQRRTPSDRLGRVMSLYALVFRFAPAVGAVLLGAAADRLGLQLAAGLFPIAVFLGLAFAWRSMLADSR